MHRKTHKRSPNQGPGKAWRVSALLAFTVLGYTLLHQTQAATYAASKEVESANLSGSASLASSSTASASSAIRFGGSTAAVDLSDPVKKEIAMQLVSSAENSSLNWKAQYAYIEDIGDGRGYTGGIVGFTSGTHDMLELVQYYNRIAPNNVLQKYTNALIKVDGTASHTGLGTAFENDWKTAAKDSKFQQAQNDERDRSYFNPAVSQGKADGLRTLGQFIYYDALVVHGPGSDSESFGGIRSAALKKAKTPAQGGTEAAYLTAFMDARNVVMKMEEAHADTSRVDKAQRVFLSAGNFNLNVPLNWSVYGDPYSIKTNPTP